MENAAIVKTIFATVAGFAIYWLGGLDELLIALIALIVLDYITGILKSWHQRLLSSEVGFRGIAKKVMILGVVAMSYIIQGLVADNLPLREITITFFAANEAISVLENAGAMGLPLPQKLKDALAQLHEKLGDEKP